MFARLAEMFKTLSPWMLIVIFGAVLLGLSAVAGWFVARGRRTAGRRASGGADPIIVGRTTSCSLCDTTFSPPLGTREWARCPRCRALVRV